MKPVACLALGLLLGGCATAPDHTPAAMRQRFAPAAHARAGGSGAFWSKLGPPNEAGVAMAQAWATVGDIVPLQDAGGQTLFDIAVRDGNDERLVVEIRAKGAPRQLDLRRDRPVPVEVAERQYELLYPSVYVAPGGNATTDKAMLIVLRRP